MSTIASHSPLNIWKTVRDRGVVPKYHQYERSMQNRMVTWRHPWKVKLVTQISLEPQWLANGHISAASRDRQISVCLENIWRCYIATIANYYRCDADVLWGSSAVRSAIMATALLLVLLLPPLSQTIRYTIVPSGIFGNDCVMCNYGLW